MMSWLDALIMGIVQGLAEYLPISSSGHLEIFHDILGLKLSGADSLQFDILLHVATVLSTIVILWREFVPLCVSFFTFKRDNNTQTVIKILISCIPILIVGLCFKDMVETFFGGSLLIVGVCLCVTAMLLVLAWRWGTRAVSSRSLVGRPAGHNISYSDAFIIGCAQAVAVLPGLSRSGATIGTGLLLGDRRDQVASFSFLMVIIPILGQALLDIREVLSGGEVVSQGQIGWLACLVGFLAAFIVGCIACKWMLNIVRRGKLYWFALYCLIVGVLCIVW